MKKNGKHSNGSKQTHAEPVETIETEAPPVEDTTPADVKPSISELFAEYESAKHAHANAVAAVTAEQHKVSAAIGQIHKHYGADSDNLYRIKGKEYNIILRDGLYFFREFGQKVRRGINIEV